MANANSTDPSIVLAHAHRRVGRIREAEAVCRELLQHEPSHGAALCLLGRLVFEAGRHDEAAGLLRQAVEAEPANAQFRSSLGAVLGRIGHHADAMLHLREAVRLRPDDSQSHNNLGAALFALGKVAEAITFCQKATAIRPSFSDAHVNLARALQASGHPGEAARAYRQALRLTPDHRDALSGLAICLMDLGRTAEGVQWLRKAVALCPDDADLHSTLVGSLNYLDDLPPEPMLEEHLYWAALHAEVPSDCASPNSSIRAPERRLRVAYVSPDFREHPFARSIEPLLAGHNRKDFEVFCYSDVIRADRLTEHFRSSVDAWRDVAGVSDEALAQLVRRDGIDILVDPTGHMKGGRLRVFARKPAPVQVAYPGYVHTSGVRAIDYVLTDAWQDPPGITERFHTERIWRLGRSARFYQPSEGSPGVGALPALANQYVTFGVLNRTEKVTAKMADLWAQILAAHPPSRLLVLVSAFGSNDASLRPHYSEVFLPAFRRHGLDSRRLELVGRRPRNDYLRLLGQVDVALDTFPYHGCTTTCDALWMGVPTVVLAGDTHAARVGVGFLSAVGLEECVTASPEAYIETALQLARDLPRLAALREGMRARLRGSELMDGPGLVRAVEGAYREMWRRWCKGTTTPTPHP